MHGDNKYNGWANWATWSVALNMDEIGGLDEDIEHLIDVHIRTPGLKPGDLDFRIAVYDMAEIFKDFFMEITEVEITTPGGNVGFIYAVCDIWTQRDMNNVDWIEIVEKRFLDV